MTDSEKIIKEALECLSKRLNTYRVAKEYYRGKHQLCFATEKFKNAFGSLFRTFADNLMSPVVDAVKDNLLVTGFNVEEGESDIPNAAWKIWQKNRMTRRSKEVHLEALRAGDAYVIVWPDSDGNPVIYPNRAELCTVKYDDEIPGKIIWAVKTWQTTDKKCRLNIYFDDRIEKYISARSQPNGMPTSGKGFVEYADEEGNHIIKHSYGVVPVFHFANNASVGEMGRCEHADAIPLNDALNKSILDMLVSAEFTAFQQRWATGIEIEYDTKGKPIPPFTPGVERLWVSESADTKFGQFDSADLDQFIKVQESFRMEIARVSATPLHYFMLQSGNFPSGESLKTAEKRFIAKITDRQEAFGEVWEEVMSLALRIENESTDARLFVEWEDSSPVSEQEKLSNLTIKKDIGVSETQLLIEAGYGLKDIEKMQAEKSVKREEAQAQFDAGQV